MKTVGDKDVDKYNIKDANICLRCDDVIVMSKGNGRRWCICDECAEKLTQIRKHWEKYGLFVGVKK